MSLIPLYFHATERAVACRGRGRAGSGRCPGPRKAPQRVHAPAARISASALPNRSCVGPGLPGGHSADFPSPSSRRRLFERRPACGRSEFRRLRRGRVPSRDSGSADSARILEAPMHEVGQIEWRRHGLAALHKIWREPTFMPQPIRSFETPDRSAAFPGLCPEGRSLSKSHAPSSPACGAHSVGSGLFPCRLEFLVLPTSAPLHGSLRRQCRECDACGSPAFNQDLPGLSFESQVVWMIRHCRPFHLNQPLRKQLHVENQAGGSDESVEHRDSVTARTEPDSAMSVGLTGGQVTMSGIGRPPAAGTGRARVHGGSGCAGCR